MALNLLLEMTDGWFSTYVDTSAAPGTSYRSRIRKAVIYALENRIIAGGNGIRYTPNGEYVVENLGYNSTIHRAYDPPRDWESMPEFPSGNIYTENEFCENSANVQLEQNQGLLHNSFILRITMFLNDANDPALAQDKILADIQKYFGINYHIPDSNGNATAHVCYYQSSTPFGTEKMRPKSGIDIEIKVWYRQQLINPAETG